MSWPRRTPPSTQTSVAAVDGGDDALQDVDGRLHAVELASAVVAGHDRVHAVLRGKVRVLGGHDALQDEGQRRPASDRREVVPREAGEQLLLQLGEAVGVDPTAVGRARSRRREVAVRSRELEPGAPVALPVAQQRQVHGQHDRRVPGGLRALDELAGAGRLCLRVELEPADAVRGRLRDLLHRAGRQRREDERDAGRRRSAGRGRLGVGMGQAVGRHRGDGERHGRRLAQHRRPGVDPGDVDEHARP